MSVKTGNCRNNTALQKFLFERHNRRIYVFLKVSDPRIPKISFLLYHHVKFSYNSMSAFPLILLFSIVLDDFYISKSTQFEENLTSHSDLACQIIS